MPVVLVIVCPVVCVSVAVLSGSLFECRANLVIVPDRFMKEWQDELEAHCPSLRVIVFTSLYQLLEVTYIIYMCSMLSIHWLHLLNSA